MSYQAPTEEIGFALMHEAGFARLIECGKYPDLSPDLVSAILGEAAKLANEVTAPLYHEGDNIGVKFEDGAVQVPPPFKAAYDAYAKGGWAALAAPPAYGGQGLPVALSNAVTEMMNANIGLQLCPMLTGSGIEALTTHGTKAQKDVYLPHLISGKWSATMLLTEAHAGSDVGSIRTKAAPQDDGSYRLSGTKIFITYGEHDLTENIIHFVLARTPNAPAGTKGISLFFVPKFLVNDDGTLGARNDIACIGVEKKMGIHASPTCTMALGEKGEGARGWLVGQEFQGMACMFTMMNNARLHVGLQGVGVAEAATQHAVAFAQTRLQGRAFEATDNNEEAVAIAHHPDVQRMLLTMRALTDAARAICYENAVAADMAHTLGDENAKLRNDLLTPISKAFSTDIANEVASLGVQVHGGMGFIEETGAAQYMRDARILPIYEGTNGIQAIDLVMRKVPLAKGAVVRDYIGEMRETAERCRQSNHTVLGEIALALGTALDALEEATAYVQKHLKDDRKSVLAAATPYLRLFGLAAGGHYLGRGALATLAQNEELGAAFPPAFAKRKMVTAQFFAHHLLSQCGGLAQSVVQGRAALQMDALIAP